MQLLQLATPPVVRYLDLEFLKMGSYNADPVPNNFQMDTLSRRFNFVPAGRLLSDQWSIDAENRVTSFADGTNNIRFKIKFDPNAFG